MRLNIRVRPISVVHASAWAIIPLMLLALGCNSDPTASIKLTSVSGKVLYKNKPLDKASIVFYPEAGGEGSSPGQDITGEDGSFNAKYRNRLGLAPGKYKVLVTKASTSDSTVNTALGDDPYMASLAAGGTGGANSTGIAAEYGDPAKTPLSLEVIDGQAQTDLVFEVK